jgi:hypothetical protein
MITAAIDSAPLNAEEPQTDIGVDRLVKPCRSREHLQVIVPVPTAPMPGTGSGLQAIRYGRHRRCFRATTDALTS